jgi:hypothetical protein
VAFQPGEIYFVREIIGDGYGPFVKIGLVARKEGRDSMDRLKEHQTGNPRVLRIDPKQIVKTEAVHRVEAQLHKIFAPQRVSGEWFSMPDETLVTQAIAEAKNLATEVAKIVPIFEKAEELSKVSSTENKIEADAECLALVADLSMAKTELGILNNLESIISEKFVQAVKTGEDLKGAAKVISVTYKPEFKVAEFKSDNEELYLKYVEIVETWKQKFTPPNKKLSADELSPEFKTQISEIEGLISAVNRPEDAYKLNEPLLLLTNLRALSEWDYEVSIAKLKVICGSTAGIEGVCTWTRKFADPKEVFNEKKFVEENPEMYLDYLAEAKTGQYIRAEKRKA